MVARPVRLLSAFLTVGSWTLGSRIFGFVRDVMIAAYLGAGPAAEAFVIAFRLPNMFRRFFGEGAFNMAFVPLFTRRLEGEGEAPARQFAEEALAGLASTLIVLTVAGQVFMPGLVWLMAGGFDDPAKTDLALVYARIAFPYVFFISIAAMLSGLLNALGRFWAAAATPVLLNVVMITFMSVGAAVGGDVGDWLIWSVFFGGVAQLTLLAVLVRKAGFALKLIRPRWTPGVKRLLTLGVPGMLAGGVTQVNLLVGTRVASSFDGAVAWLQYADRLYSLPFGIAGVAIGVVLLPDLSRRLRGGDEAGARWSLNRAAEFAMTLTLPCTAALVAIPTTLVAVLFQRGAFTAADTAATGALVAIYAAVLPALVFNKILAPVFFAREDTATPFRYAAVSMVVNVTLAVGLAPLIGFMAPAVAMVVAGWTNVTLVFLKARRIGPEVRLDERLLRRGPRIALAAAACGVSCVILANLLAPALAAQGWRYLAIAAVVIGGTAVYGMVATATGALAWSDFKTAMTRRPAPAKLEN